MDDGEMRWAQGRRTRPSDLDVAEPVWQVKQVLVVPGGWRGSGLEGLPNCNQTRVGVLTQTASAAECSAHLAELRQAGDGCSPVGPVLIFNPSAVQERRISAP